MAPSPDYVEGKDGEGLVSIVPIDSDTEFGGSEERRMLERKLVRKLDCRMFILPVIYLLNYIDRNNAAAARLRGFESDLHLKDQQYDTVLSIMYVGYILMQVPSNMFLDFIGRPSIYFPACVTTWGIISILTGTSKNFAGVMLARSFLGVTEAVFFPGALFLLSKWYTRRELGLRMTVLISSSLLSNAFGSLMASGILDGMQGKLGQAAWRWLFFIEGSLTIAVALAAIFILPDFPANTRWLTPLERRLALRRMEEDGGINSDDQEGLEPIIGVPERTKLDESGLKITARPGKCVYRFRGLVPALSDLRVWWFAVALLSSVAGMSFSSFLPTLVATLGFSRTVTLVLVAPPAFLAAILAFWNARHSDKQGERFYHIAVPLVVGILGLVIGMTTMNIVARYISLCMMCMSYGGYMIIFSWISNSIPRPPSKRAVALAFINGFSQLGAIAGSYCFPIKWGPSYRKSYGICVALQGLTIIMCWIFRRHLKAQNVLLEKAGQERCDRQKAFRYLL